MDHQASKSSFTSSMIWTCHNLIRMTLKAPSLCWDNTLTTSIGTMSASSLLRISSTPRPWLPSTPVQDHSLSTPGTWDTSGLFPFHSLIMSHCRWSTQPFSPVTWKDSNQPFKNSLHSSSDQPWLSIRTSSLPSERLPLTSITSSTWDISQTFSKACCSRTLPSSSNPKKWSNCGSTSPKEPTATDWCPPIISPSTTTSCSN